MLNQPQNNNSVVDVSTADMDRFRKLEEYLGQQANSSSTPIPQYQTSNTSPLIEKLKGASIGAPSEIPGVTKIKVGNNFETPPSISNIQQFGQPQPASIQSEIFGGTATGINETPPPQLFQQPTNPQQANTYAQQFSQQPLVIGNAVNLSQPSAPHDFSNLTPETRVAAQQMSAQNPALVQRIQKNLKLFNVRIPSGGIYYANGNSFRGIQEVQMRKILNRDDDIIRSSKLLNEGKAFTTLIKNLLIDKNLDGNDLFDGDLWSLLIASRCQSFGSLYNSGIEFICDFCTSKFEYEFDLSSLQPILPDPAYRHVDNIFETVLPGCGLTALIKVFTNKDTEILNSVITASNRQMVHDKIDRTESTTARQHVVALDGETDPSSLNDAFDNWIEVVDKLYIIEFAKEMEPRLKFTQNIICPNCSGTLENIRIPFTDRLFTPKMFNKKK